MKDALRSPRLHLVVRLLLGLVFNITGARRQRALLTETKEAA